MKRIIILSILLLLLIASGCHTSQADPTVEQIPAQPVTESITESITEEEPPEQDPTEEPVAPAGEPPAETVPHQPEAVTADSKSWYLKPNLEHQPPQIDGSVQNMADEGVFYYALPQNAPQVYLTFDEGYELGYTGQILDILKEHQVPAVFFITGHYLTSQPDLVKRMVAEGHQVANHTYNHPNLSQVSKERFQNEVSQLEQEFTSLTGSAMAPFLRPPAGNYSTASLQWAKELNYTTVFWSLAFHDWDPNNQPGADYSYQYVIDHIHPGAIILLHAVSESNTQALPQIIEDVRAAGYVFAPLPQ